MKHYERKWQQLMATAKGMLIVGLVILTGGWVAFRYSGNGTLEFVGLAALPTGLYLCGKAGEIWEQLVRRKQRAEKEQGEIQKFVKMRPSYWIIESDIVIQGAGNIDILVTLPGRSSVVVNIKRGQISLDRIAQAQVDNMTMKDAVDADLAIVWFPEAPKFDLATYPSRDFVVLGDHNELVARIVKLVQRFR